MQTLWNILFIGTLIPQPCSTTASQFLGLPCNDAATETSTSSRNCTGRGGACSPHSLSEARKAAESADQSGAFTEAIVHAWTLANKYEIDFESAMVIVVGQQSAGKTSFVERYLGYAFSVVRNGIATKRPSVLTILPCEPQDELQGADVIVKLVEELKGGGKSAEVQFKGKEALHNLHAWVAERNQEVAKEKLFITIVTKQCKTPRRITDLPGVRANDEPECEGVNKAIVEMVSETMVKPNSIMVCLAEATSEPVP